MKTIILDVKRNEVIPSIIEYLNAVTVIDDTRIVLSNACSVYPSPDAMVRCEVMYDGAYHPFCSSVDILGKIDISFWCLNKQVQSQIINKFCEGLDGFKSLLTCTPLFLNSTAFTSSKVIAKPSMGARSIGQVVFNALKHNPSSIFQAIKEQKSDTELEKYFDDEGIHAKYFYGTQRQSEEGYMLLSQGMIFQEYVDDIANEFRIIVGADNTPVISIDRKFKMLGFDHRIPSNLPDAVTTSALQDLYPEVHEGLLNFLSKLEMPFHSIDVFVTKNKQWGIFEFSPEFCSSEYGPVILAEQAKQFLRKYLLNSLP